jgi:hypothetical protein
MSQFYTAQSGVTPIPPSVPTEFVADDSTIAVPAGNILNVLSRDNGINNLNGIQTTANPNLSNNLYVQLTNRVHGTTTTVGAVTSNAITFPLGATPGTFFLTFTVAVFNASTPAGAGYETYTTIRTDGTTATVIGDTDSITHEDPVLVASNAQVVVSGNNVIFQVTGVAGLSVDWTVVGTYLEAT